MGNAKSKEKNKTRSQYISTTGVRIANRRRQTWEEPNEEEGNAMWKRSTDDDEAAANDNRAEKREDSCFSESFVIGSLPGMMKEGIAIRLKVGRDKRKTLVQETEKIGE